MTDVVVVVLGVVAECVVVEERLIEMRVVIKGMITIQFKKISIFLFKLKLKSKLIKKWQIFFYSMSTE